MAELAAELAAGGREPDGLVLVNRRLPRRTNSVLRDGTRPPGPTLLMHPSDAQRLQLRPGQEVTVTSAHGATSAELEVTDTIRPGVVSLPHAWNVPHVNRLTSERHNVERKTGMPRLSGVPVAVETLS